MQKIISPMVPIGALLSVSLLAPTTVCAQQQLSMQQSAGLPQYSQTTGNYYQGNASAAVTNVQQAYPRAYSYPATAQQIYSAAAGQQNFQAQQPYPAEQQGNPSQQNFSAQQGYPVQQGCPAQQGYPTQQGFPEQAETTQEQTYVQGAESQAYQDSETPYEAQERAIQQANQGVSKIDTPAAEAMMQQQQSPPANMSGRVAQTSLSSAMRTAGKVALVALPVTAIVLLTRSAATSSMMSPSMGMMRMGGIPNMGMSGMRLPMSMGSPMGIGLSSLLNRLR